MRWAKRASFGEVGQRERRSVPRPAARTPRAGGRARAASRPNQFACQSPRPHDSARDEAAIARLDADRRPEPGPSPAAGLAAAPARRAAPRTRAWSCSGSSRTTAAQSPYPTAPSRRARTDPGETRPHGRAAVDVCGQAHDHDCEGCGERAPGSARRARRSPAAAPFDRTRCRAADAGSPRRPARPSAVSRRNSGCEERGAEDLVGEGEQRVAEALEEPGRPQPVDGQEAEQAAQPSTRSWSGRFARAGQGQAVEHERVAVVVVVGEQVEARSSGPARGRQRPQRAAIRRRPRRETATRDPKHARDSDSSTVLTRCPRRELVIGHERVAWPQRRSAC